MDIALILAKIKLNLLNNCKGEKPSKLQDKDRHKNL